MRTTPVLDSAKFGDYVAIVIPASEDEIAHWKVTAERKGWAIPEKIDAKVGMFSSPTGNVMDLPYELRSTVMLISGDPLIPLSQHFDDLVQRVTFDIETAYDDRKRQRLADEMDAMLGKKDERGFYRDWSL